MSIDLQEHVDLAELTTFKIGGTARYFVQITSAQQLPEIFEWLSQKSLPYFILSGGSNTIFGDGEFEGLVIKINIQGFEVIKEDGSSATLKVGAGENWDNVVARTVDMKLSGIEALSLIPGLAGTAPVQNIGAYGQEIMNVTSSVEVFDTHTTQLSELSNAQCEFSYRDSIFKSSQKGRYIITAITLQLSKAAPQMPNYPDVTKYFAENKVAQPTLEQIREAIIAIRTHKLPDPAKIPNAGSFFKNPIVSPEVLEPLQAKFPDIKSFPFGHQHKLSAGWLIEHVQLKGYKQGHVQVDPSHALVLENTGGASQKELQELVATVQQAVQTKFGIHLDPEPEIVHFTKNH